MIHESMPSSERGEDPLSQQELKALFGRTAMFLVRSDRTQTRYYRGASPVSPRDDTPRRVSLALNPELVDSTLSGSETADETIVSARLFFDTPHRLEADDPEIFAHVGLDTVTQLDEALQLTQSYQVMRQNDSYSTQVFTDYVANGSRVSPNNLPKLDVTTIDDDEIIRRLEDFLALDRPQTVQEFQRLQQVLDSVA